MLVTDLLTAASKGISVNKSRALLTMLGIIIGVGAVVLMTGVGKSMEGVILGQISSLGAESMVIFPGNQGPEAGPSSARSGFDSITFDDIEALNKLTTIETVAPIIFVPGDVMYGNESSDSDIQGNTPDYYLNQNLSAGAGRLLDETDEAASRSVVVIGSDTAEDLFYNQNPIDKRIRVAGRTYTVVGVLEPVGMQFFQNFDKRVIMPFSTARAVTGQNFVNMATMRAVDGFDIAFADVRSLLRQRHGIVIPPDRSTIRPDGSSEDDDFLVRSSAQAAEILGTVSLGLTLFITMVAAISLVVGGIGIMNIMLVAVTERTREIGLRKALGATRRDILLQFLCESVLLTFIGGLIGTAIGIMLAFLIARIVQGFLGAYVFAISFPAVIIALLTAAGVGLTFGIYPARRAASLDPIDALRYE